MGIHDLWLFMLAGLLLNITPGPDMALVMARSTQQGARAGVAAALGIGAGALLHIAAATAGLSALLLASAFAFTLVKVAGALYLMWLGLGLLRGAWKGQALAPDAMTLSDIVPARAFWQGVLTNALNPKVAMFFLAFLPQFVDSDAPHRALGFLVLGLIFDAVGTAWNVLVALLASRLALSRLGLSLQRWLDVALGLLFLGFGVKLVLAARS